MKMEPGQAIAVGGGAAVLEALAAALRRLAEGGAAEDVLQEIAEAAATGAGADLALVWIRGERSLEARIVTAASTSVAAELQGSRVGDAETEEEGRSIGRRLGLAVSIEFPITVADHDLGRLELFRRAGAFSPEERAFGELAAEHAGVALAGIDGNGDRRPLGAADLLRLGGDALATGLDERRTAEEFALLAAQATNARGAYVRRLGDDTRTRAAS